MDMMFLHYLKSAVRSLTKYKVQTIASVVGLTLGFVCFALSAVWVRYEQTFDSFHRGADRMYLLGSNSWRETGLSHRFLLAEELKETFPEVEDAAAYWYLEIPVMLSEDATEAVNLGCIRTDSLFVHMFDVRLMRGSWSFLNVPEEVALTEEGALRLFGTTDVLGRTVYCQNKTYRISAVLTGWGQHTNFPFSIMLGMDQDEKNNTSYCDYYISLRLRAGVDTAALVTQMNNSSLKYKVSQRWDGKKCVLSLEPLTHCRYTVFQDKLSVSIFYIRLFSALGLLLIVLALVNFFSMSVSRMYLRRRELALRIACGSSRVGLTGLFLSELLLILSGAVLLGMILVEAVENPFCMLSGIEGSIRLSVVVCFLLLTAVIFLMTWGITAFYCNRIASRQLQPAATVSPGRFSFQKICLGVQFGICALVLFCLSFLLLQLSHLTHTDIGFERNGRATVYCYGSESLNERIIHELRRQPYVQEVKKLYSLLPQRAHAGMAVSSWDGKSDNADPITLNAIPEGQEFINFYGLRLIAGNTLITQGDTMSVVINETAARMMNMANPVGKKVGPWLVVGVVRDFHVSAPTVPVEPTVFLGFNGPLQMGRETLVRFDESETERMKHFVDSLVQSEEPGVFLKITTVREAYEEYLRSERTLQKLLTVVAVVCVQITLIGVFAHVSLVCEQRRKEIAIRKVNGATASGIFRSFLKEYFALLLVACIIAFPLGSVAMQ
ncbi:hypothetical protein QUW02_10965, partial [Bacteroides eggerthii]|nr:hypothetical protein [Bacteroides eggerthii]